MGFVFVTLVSSVAGFGRLREGRGYTTTDGADNSSST